MLSPADSATASGAVTGLGIATACPTRPSPTQAPQPFVCDLGPWGHLFCARRETGHPKNF